MCHFTVITRSLPFLSSTFFFSFFNDPPTTELYTLSLHDALPILPHLLTLWVCKLLMLICILTKNVITSCSVTMMLFLHLEVKPLMTLTTVLYLLCALISGHLAMMLMELTKRRYASFLVVFNRPINILCRVSLFLSMALCLLLRLFVFRLLRLKRFSTLTLKVL